MKAILMTLTLVLSASFASAGDQRCEEGIAYQPGGNSLVEASDSFAMELLIAACAVDKLANLKKDQVAHLISYDSPARVLIYEVVDFSVSPATKTTCRSVAKQVVRNAAPGEPVPAVYQERWSKPSCTQPIVAR